MTVRQSSSVQAERRAGFIHVFVLGSLTLGVLQVYVLPFFPMAIWWILALSPFVLLGRRDTKMGRFVPALVAIAVVQFFSLGWSPDPLQALRSAATTIALLVVVMGAAELLRTDEAKLGRVLSISGVFVALHALLISAFFLWPKLEADYLRSSIAPFFSGQGVTRIYTDLFNNVVLEGKAGGFFVNGNTASMFMGMCAALFVATAIKFRSKWHVTVALCAYIGSLMTGSKTALFIGTVWIGACWLLYAAARKAHLVFPGLLIAVIAVQAGLALLLERAPEFGQDSSHTFGSRQLMWNVAFKGLSDSPILGLGFGGWFDQYEKFGSEIGFSVRPAHNLILQTWLDSGVLGVITLLVLFASILIACVKVFGYRYDKGLAAMACSLLAASGWIFIHGQGDNTAFYGDTHSLAFLGVALALLGHVRDRAGGDLNGEFAKGKTTGFIKDTQRVARRGSRVARTETAVKSLLN